MTMKELKEHIRLGRGAFGMLTDPEAEELWNFLDVYEESRAQCMYSLTRAIMKDGRSGYNEIDWLEHHEWWPK